MATVNIQLAGQKRMENLARRTQRLQVLRVEPADKPGRWTAEAIRRVFKHPVSGMKFPSEGSAEWPDDAFTRRRLADGSIKIAEDNPDQKKPDRPERPVLQRAAAARQSAE
jgi:hypothetical protein